MVYSLRFKPPPFRPLETFWEHTCSGMWVWTLLTAEIGQREVSSTDQMANLAQKVFRIIELDAQ